MQSYVVHVSHAGDGYHATVSSTVPGYPVDAMVDPSGARGTGEASTSGGAILAAVISAQIPDLSGPRRRFYAV